MREAGSGVGGVKHASTHTSAVMLTVASLAPPSHVSCLRVVTVKLPPTLHLDRHCILMPWITSTQGEVFSLLISPATCAPPCLSSGLPVTGPGRMNSLFVASHFLHTWRRNTHRCQEHTGKGCGVTDRPP